MDMVSIPTDHLCKETTSSPSKHFNGPVCLCFLQQGILKQSKLRSISKSDTEMNKMNCNGKSECVLHIPPLTCALLTVPLCHPNVNFSGDAKLGVVFVACQD